MVRVTVELELFVSDGSPLDAQHMMTTVQQAVDVLQDEHEWEIMRLGPNRKFNIDIRMVTQ